MMRYVITEAALADIREITRYIRTVQKSPQNARLVATRLKQQFAKRPGTPDLGHRREELEDENIRVIQVTGLLVLYDPTLKPLTMLRVIHPARDLHRIRPRG
jgi:antitoxin ParD1/3/4/toxin ParE1/3/4